MLCLLENWTRNIQFSRQRSSSMTLRDAHLKAVERRLVGSLLVALLGARQLAQRRGGAREDG